MVRSQLIYSEVITFHFVSGGSSCYHQNTFNFQLHILFLIKIYGNLEIWLWYTCVDLDGPPFNSVGAYVKTHRPVRTFPYFRWIQNIMFVMAFRKWINFLSIVHFTKVTFVVNAMKLCRFLDKDAAVSSDTCHY